MREAMALLLSLFFLLGCTAGTDYLQEYGAIKLSEGEVQEVGLTFSGEPFQTNLKDGFEQKWKGQGENELRIEYRMALDEEKRFNLKWQGHEYSRQDFENIYSVDDWHFAYCKNMTEAFVICHFVEDFYHVSVYLVEESDSDVKGKAISLMEKVRQKI
jgi:hypothetical protein